MNITDDEWHLCDVSLMIWCRYELIDRTSRCNITLATTLQRQDNNRKWRCQVNTKDSSRVMSLDFTSTFLFDSPAQDLLPSASFDCAHPLPVSRILLCVALPVMVIIVGCFRGDCKRAKTSAANIELQEIHWLLIPSFVLLLLLTQNRLL